MPVHTRRAFLGGLSSLAVSGWIGSSVAEAASAASRSRAEAAGRTSDDSASALYGPVSGEPFPVPAVNLKQIDPAYLRAHVSYDGAEPPGTIVIDPATRYLYLVQPGGRAIRYGVGVGREGFAWSGTATIKSKQEWPDWYPPKEMLARQPELMRVMRDLQGGLGMPGGPHNPLGARAMYLWQGNKDTLYRIHGTSEPWTIGHAVSSGCIRMINQDAIDLYNRVPLGTTVVVLGSHGQEVASGRRRKADERAQSAYVYRRSPYGQDSQTYGYQQGRVYRSPQPGAYYVYPQGSYDPYSGSYGYPAYPRWYRVEPERGF